MAARERRSRVRFLARGNTGMSEDPGGSAYIPTFPAIGDSEARTSRAAGYSKIRDVSGSESSAKFFNASEDYEPWKAVKRGKGRRNEKWKSGKNRWEKGYL